jgi:hypothetical protein
MSTSSERIRSVEPVRHASDDSGERPAAKYLSFRHGQLNGRAPALPVDRQSTGRIVSLGAGRFGVLAPRAPKGRFRRPIAAVDSMEEGQAVLRDWRQARDNIVEFVVRLAGLVPRPVAQKKWKLPWSKSGVRARPGAKKAADR